jgi:hypothetical protein
LSILQRLVFLKDRPSAYAADLASRMLYFEIAFVVFPLAHLDVSIAFFQLAVRVPKGSDVRSLFHDQLYAYLKPK